MKSAALPRIRETESLWNNLRVVVLFSSPVCQARILANLFRWAISFCHTAVYKQRGIMRLNPVLSVEFREKDSTRAEDCRIREYVQSFIVRVKAYNILL